jgi:protein SCO1/2
MNIRQTVRECAVVMASSVMLALVTSHTAGASASESEQQDRVKLTQSPVQVPNFSLRNQDAGAFAFSDFRGQTALIFFGFTHCRSVCPPTMQNLRQVHRSLEAESIPITVVFISVDGQRDTPEVMKDYLAPFKPGFIGLTGDPRTVSDIAATFPAVFFKGMPTDTEGGYDVEHSSQIYLVDLEGRLRATFYNASATTMIDAIRRVIQQDNKQEE